MRLSRFITMIAILAMVVMTAPASGLARRHLRLVKSEPASDAVVKVSPAVLRLYFSEEPELKATMVKVVGKDGAAAGLGSFAAMKDAKAVHHAAGTRHVFRILADDVR